jgi:polar amino acid transport system substrate-binding protein
MRSTGAAVTRISRLLLLAGILAGCADIPKDPADTLANARGGVLRVGVAAAPPWVVRPDGTGGGAVEPSGREADLVRSFARSIDARVEWVWGGAEESLHGLERRELAVVAAGLTRDSPWNGRVALTRPHARTGEGEHVLAVAPGENALLVAVERHIRLAR